MLSPCLTFTGGTQVTTFLMPIASALRNAMGDKATASIITAILTQNSSANASAPTATATATPTPSVQAADGPSTNPTIAYWMTLLRPSSSGSSSTPNGSGAVMASPQLPVDTATAPPHPNNDSSKMTLSSSGGSSSDSPSNQVPLIAGLSVGIPLAVIAVLLVAAYVVTRQRTRRAAFNVMPDVQGRAAYGRNNSREIQQEQQQQDQCHTPAMATAATVAMQATAGGAMEDNPVSAGMPRQDPLVPVTAVQANRNVNVPVPPREIPSASPPAAPSTSLGSQAEQGQHQGWGHRWVRLYADPAAGGGGTSAGNGEP